MSKCQASGTDDDAAPSSLVPPRQGSRRLPTPASTGKPRPSPAQRQPLHTEPLPTALRHALHGRACIYSRQIAPRHPHCRHRPRVSTILDITTSASAFHGHLFVVPGQALRRRREWYRWPYTCAVSLADDPLQQSDASALLGDNYQPQYGTLDPRPQHPPQPDPEELRREREELEQICADTSR